MAASLTEIHQSLQTWLASKVRIDRWTLDPPSQAVRVINGVAYPANTAVLLPAERIDFFNNDAGAMCEANFYFKVVYRFTKKILYDNLPIEVAEGILNNIYLDALQSPATINPAIFNIETPEVGTDVIVSAFNEQDTTNDWLIVLQPAFRIRFKVKKADVGILQPGDGEGPTYEFNSLTIGLYRSPVDEVGNEEESRLDRTIKVWDKKTKRSISGQVVGPLPTVKGNFALFGGQASGEVTGVLPIVTGYFREANLIDNVWVTPSGGYWLTPSGGYWTLGSESTDLTRFVTPSGGSWITPSGGYWSIGATATARFVTPSGGSWITSSGGYWAIETPIGTRFTTPNGDFWVTPEGEFWEIT